MKWLRPALPVSRTMLASAIQDALPVADTGCWVLRPDDFASVCIAVEDRFPDECDRMTTAQLRAVVDEVRRERYTAVVEQAHVALRAMRDALPLHPSQPPDGCGEWQPKEMLPEYVGTLGLVRELTRRALKRVGSNKDATLLGDVVLLRSMDEDLQWTIKYMATGDDGPMMERVRVVPVDPQSLQAWIEERQTYTPINNADAARSDALSVLDELSDRELEAYKLVKAEGFSYADAARLMGIGKWTVRDYIERAKAKIAACRVLNSLPHEMTY